jgi:predicted Zn-dependent protease
LSLDAALERLRAGQPRAALPLLESHVAGRPTDARAWFLLGASRHELRDAAGALEAFEGSIALSSDPNGIYASAVALDDLGCADDALGRVRAKLKANRGTAPLFDTTSRVRQLEAAFAELYRRYRAQIPPASFGL